MILRKQQQAERHHDHPGDQAIDRQVVLAVLFRRRKELVQRDKDHDPAHGGKEQAKDHVVEQGRQQQVADQRADRLGEPGEKGPQKGAPLAPGGIVEGDRDGDPFRDVVDGDGHGDAQAQGRVLERAGKGGQSLGKVVDGDGQRREQAHAH